MATHPPLVPGVGTSAASRQRQRRNRRGEFAIWWREIDRVLLTLILALMAIGTAAVAAASPASARRLSTAALQLDNLHFFVLHLRWQAIGLAVMLGASCLSKAWRASLTSCRSCASCRSSGVCPASANGAAASARGDAIVGAYCGAGIETTISRGGSLASASPRLYSDWHSGQRTMASSAAPSGRVT